MTACGQTANEAAGYKAGTYEGSAKGMNGDVKLEVTFNDTGIEKISVLEQNETPGLSDPAFEKIPKDIVEHQSLAVDLVSGATFTSNALINATASCIEQAGGDVEAWKNKKVEKAENNESVAKETEVVVVGGGSAGLAAAVSAAENGSKVILLEANEYLGGNTVRTAGAMISCDPEKSSKDQPMNAAQIAEIERVLAAELESPVTQAWQDKVREEVEPYLKGEKMGVYESVELASLQYLLNNHQRVIPERLYELMEKSAETKDWLETIGMNWTEEPAVLVGHGWPRAYYSQNHKAGNGYIEVLVNYIEKAKLDVEIIKGVRANELIVENDRVSGVKASATNGQKYEIKAAQGVILATGGFSGNPELLEKYSDGFFPNIGSLNNDNDPAIRGDGILMAEQVGADFYDMGHYQLMPITDPEDGNTKTFVGSTTGLYINKDGVRFVNEASDRDTIAKAILAQKDQACYLISSQENNGIDANGQNMMGVKLDSLLESGKAVKADTLEELAEKINVDPDVLKDTVEKFNEACRNENDPEFGRVSFQPDVINQGASLEIKEGPYYACLRSPAVHITKGGILIDTESRVLDKDGNPIPGLMAAGEVTGGMAVNGIGHSLYTGRIAGMTAAAEKKA